MENDKRSIALPHNIDWTAYDLQLIHGCDRGGMNNLDLY
jgi:hypothetical protein